VFGNTEVVANCISKGTNKILNNSMEYTRWEYLFEIISPEKMWGTKLPIYTDSDGDFEVGRTYTGVFNRQKSRFMLN
jgi:hypothetical protein